MLKAIEALYKEHEGLLQMLFLSISIVIGYITIIQPLISFIRTQRNANRDKRYEIYHELITKVASGEGKPLYLQISSVYELRNFPEYYPVTNRILSGIKADLHLNKREDVKRLIFEIDATLNYIESSWIKRNLLLPKIRTSS